MMNRYPGIRPFDTSEQHLFFGRDEDIERLYRLIRLEQIVILYGKSGYGKSSLLQAGIFPKLEKEGRYQFWAVRFGPYQSERSFPPTQNVQFNVELKPAGQDWSQTKTDSIWEALKTRQTAENRRFVLFFDQFEELFTYPPEQVAAFKQQLAEALYADLPDRFRQSDYADSDAFELKVVFSIRSDRMSQLNALKDYLPNLLQHAYELDALDEQQAAAAVTEPAALQNPAFTTPPFTYAPATLRATFNALRDDMGRIETSALQIVCRYVENNLVNGEHYTVTPEALGDIKGIFRNFYDATLDALPEAECHAACCLVEDVLIKDGVRLPFAEQALLAEPGVTRELLKKLTDASLLRVERDEQGRMLYEVSHDTLVAPIGEVAAARREAEEKERLRQEAEAARQREAEARRKQRTAYLLTAGAILLALFAIGASWFAYLKSKEAGAAAQVILEKEQKVRDSERQVAEKTGQVDLKTREAAAALQRADEKEAEARRNFEEAQRQKTATAEQKRIASALLYQAKDARYQAELATVDIVHNLLDNAQQAIYRLDYPAATVPLHNALQLVAGRPQSSPLGPLRPLVADVLLEPAYVFMETGQNMKARTELAASAAMLDRPVPGLADLPIGEQAVIRPQLRAMMQALRPQRFSELEARYYPDMVAIPAGEFMMGCDSTIEGCNPNELPRHPVRLGAFSMARTETTMWQYGLYSAATGRDIRQFHEASWGEMRGNDPVINVSWYDAALYANWRSVQAGLTPAYAFADTTTGQERQYKWKVEALSGVNGYRLPTEAEWEYTARGGENFRYSGSNDADAVAWYGDNSRYRRTEPTGRKKANSWGLYDMSGNVDEWCGDRYDEIYYQRCAEASIVENPPGPTEGNFFVLRGGSWMFYGADDCRVASRRRLGPYQWGNDIGFRCARGR